MDLNWFMMCQIKPTSPGLYICAECAENALGAIDEHESISIIRTQNRDGINFLHFKFVKTFFNQKKKIKVHIINFRNDLERSTVLIFVFSRARVHMLSDLVRLFFQFLYGYYY